ncbi:hypothetical protein [Thermovirga sp.]|uniref:hypothetical protein n=1 Tax=Thermovirga sp. TaxID=2699834 RepID=UPI0025DF3C86|nr:hypothetical protein [Thermovirga sp.]MBO8153723.1 hypothetical protein [Thermovirga sp.]
MGILPYWDKNVDFEIDSWVPYRLDFSPVSINSMYSDQLEQIAMLALNLDSELLCVDGITTGQAGTLFRQNIFDPERKLKCVGWFSMVFGYSKTMERLIGLFANAFPGITAGLALCGVWDRNMLVDELKTIILISNKIVFNESGCLEALESLMRKAAKEGNDRSFFAEKFGYRRFSIPFETDDVTQLAISDILYSFELEETREILGPPPEVVFPRRTLEDLL